jgi:hypothetical protein
LLKAAILSERDAQKGKNDALATATRASLLRPKAGPASWLMWGALALAFYFLIVQLTPSRNLESEERETQQSS